jgi:signal transduction histidine kinase
LKLHLKAFWVAASALLLAVSLIDTRLAFAGDALPTNSVASAGGPVIDFKSYQGAIGSEDIVPLTGWATKQPALELVAIDQPTRNLRKNVLWGRMTFDRSQLGSKPLAIYTIGNRDQFKASVNGHELFRNYANTADQVQSWYYPFLIPVPQDVLKDGTNEIVFQNSGWRWLAIGRTSIGPQETLQRKYNAQILLRIQGPIIANAMMAFLGLYALVLWAVRRAEPELLFLSLTAGFWLIRNYHFYTTSLPIAPEAFVGLTHVSLYFAAAASASFGLSFLKTPHHQRIINAMFGFGIFVSLLHAFSPLSPLVIMVPTFIIALMTSVVGALGLRSARSPDHLMVCVVMASIIVSATHDFGRNSDLWDGVGFYFQPYVGFFFTSVFLFSFGRRAQHAFVQLGRTNETLEKRVTQVRQELALSETNRRALEIDQAIAQERVRMMREMHDGIGSNLVTALAIAEHQNQPDSMVKTLKRALSDIKITVDSLESIDGDIVVLIANLRHRMNNDLRDAGLEVSWKVEECRPVSWLDSVSALHVARIIQEAISNVIEHAKAKRITIGCSEELHGGASGISIFVADNGSGFKAQQRIDGKGIANMSARAQAIGAILSFSSETSLGTTVELWLSYGGANHIDTQKSGQ